jgi:hypothetical protein
MPLVLIASFAVLWYVVHEITPLKPYPDFSRYMVPLAPLLAILAASFVFEILSRWDRLGLVAAAAILLAALPALWTSVRINTPDIDPRDVVPQLLLDSGARVAFDRYANYSFTNKILGGRARQLSENADIVLTANLTYDRAYNYAVLLNQDPATVAGYYQALSAKPHLDISNGRPAMAYFNPVLRVIPMDGSVERLRRIEKSINDAAPNFDVRLVEGTAPR